METTKNKMTPEEHHFFKGLSDYLDTTLYYYGSIQRGDYISGKSDIDVDIFTDNCQSTLNQLMHYLRIGKKEVKKIAWAMDGVVTYGYKIGFSNPNIPVRAEFSIHEIKFKEQILHEHRRVMNLPFIIAFLLNLLKVIFYQIPLLPVSIYSSLKHFLLNDCMGAGSAIFVSW